MIFAFVAAIFASACLLFTVQPFTGKLLLPLAGGSPQVWNTCMLFFQAALLAGYLYAHALARLPLKVQGAIHAVLLALAALALPVDVAAIASSPSPTGAPSTLWLLTVLLTTVGLPFFAVSTTAPLLQSWFARSGHPRARDPYFLYVASNAGSVVGLLGYPLAIEPLLTRSDQALTWTGGYGVFFLLIATCLACTLASAARGARLSVPPARDAAAPTPSTSANSTPAPAPPRHAPINLARRAWWVLLAFVPSSLMLGVTQFISTDLAAVPLLWVVPLLLYLVTFMLSFAQSVRVPARFLGRLTPLVVAVLAMVMLSFAREPVLVVVTVHILAFFVLAWMCHKRLSDDRPDPAHLTEFYLLMSVGGVLGGIFNALLAPNLFNSVAEYPLVIALACFLTPQCAEEFRRLRDRWRSARAATGPTSGRARAIALALLLSIPLTFLALNAYLTVIDDLAALGALRTSRLQSALLGGVPVALCLIALLWNGTPRFAAGILAAMILFPGLGIRDDAFVVRTFFGVHRVTIRTQPSISVAELHHGTTLHGVQFRTDLVTGQRPPVLTPDERNALFYAPRSNQDPVALLARRARYQLLPTTYYHPTGPIGDVMRMLADTNRLDSAAFIGMGTGTLAAYAQPGSTFIFFEIDPAVVDIAHDPDHFSYIADAIRIPGVRIGTVLGDGRRTIVENTDLGPYRAIVIDAFSSDAIPVHLVTKEAVEGYVSRLTPDGVLAFHISNRYFDLSPVLARLALELNLVAFIRNDPFEIAEEQKRDSLWVVMARSPEHLAPLTSRNPLWERMGSDSKDPLWTDEYSNVLRVFVPLRPLFELGADARPAAPAAPRPVPAAP